MKMAISGNSSSAPQIRTRPRSKSTGSKHFAVRHTCIIPLLLVLTFLSLYAINPSESNVIHRFIFLSYRLAPEAGSAIDTPLQYGKGIWDIAFVSFYTIVLTFTREFVMQELLRPLACYYGIKSRAKQARFMEQLYTAIYFLVMGPVGIYVMKRTPIWYFNTRAMYEGFPHKSHEAEFKFYYLFQAAYWFQQAIVLVLGQEKPRKDFYEYIAHHIVTLFLIALSYRFHFTYMGIAVYLTHDISDFFLSLSKTLHYIDSPLLLPAFAVQIITWIYLRNYLNLRIIFSLFNEFQTVGPYELNWETQQYKCSLANVIAFGLLATLQALNLFWLMFILRIAYRFFVHNIAKDDRSEDEDSELEVEIVQEKETGVTLLPGEEEVVLGKGIGERGVNGIVNAIGKTKGSGVTKRK